MLTKILLGIFILWLVVSLLTFIFYSKFAKIILNDDILRSELSKTQRGKNICSSLTHLFVKVALSSMPFVNIVVLTTCCCCILKAKTNSEEFKKIIIEGLEDEEGE